MPPTQDGGLLGRQSATSSRDSLLSDALAGGCGRSMWASCAHVASRRADGTWLAGAMFVLILVATLPLSVLCMTILTMAAVATCLRAFALHQYTQRLAQLALHEQAEAGGGGEGGGAASGAAGSLSSAAQRRPRRASLLTAVAAAGRPFSLLHLRLSLVDRDFTEPEDYELLLRLDELEAGAQHEAQPPPPAPESQLALLPVHVHRTPTKKAKRQRGPFEAAMLRAAAEPPQPFPSGAAASEPAALRASGRQPALVPVVQEQPRPEWAAAAADRSGLPAAAALRPSASSGSLSGRAGGGRRSADAPALMEREIVAAGAAGATPALPSSESEEDEEILCSVCLEPFDDGAKILSLPCHHQYHEACVKTWLRYKGAEATCPNCKGTVFHAEQQAQQPAAA